MAGDDTKTTSGEKVTVSSVSMHLPPPSPVEIKGDVVENWKFFKLQFSNYSIATGLNDKDENIKVATLLSVIGKDCLKIFTTLDLNNTQRGKVAEILKGFDKYFEPEKNVIYERFVFGSANQEPNKKIEQYICRLRQLSSTCDYKSLESELIRDRLVLGVQDLGLRKKLLSDPKLTLSTAIDYCRAYEATDTQLKHLNLKDTVDVKEEVHKMQGTSGRHRTQGCIAQELQIMPAMPVQAKPIGKKVLLTCRAPDDKGLISQLQWLDPQNNTIRNDNPLTRDRLSVEKMTPDTLALIFSSLKDSEAGVYTCTAMYAGSQAISKSVRIDTIYAITWIDAPEEQYPIMGSKYKVKCKVQANPSPIVDWLRNGQQIHSTGNGRYVIDNDGLVIKNVTEEDDGIYICRAIVLDTGELSERNIKVEVQIPPSFDEKMPATVEVVEGESASVTCMARGKPKPHYAWIRSDNDLNLASSGRSTVNENTGVLTITRVSKEDNGEIRCMATNAAGSMERTVNLVVIIKPQVMDIQNISVPIRKTARLICRATGNPEPAVTFWKIGAALEMVKGAQPADPRIVVETKAGGDGVIEAHLVIEDLTRPDDGLYTCIARNKGGESRKNGHLTVEFPPNFDNTPMKEAWSWNRLPVNLTCLAESIPNATITWRLNERDIERDPNFKKFGSGAWSTLLVTPVDIKYYGVYKCTARNKHGEVSHTIKLTEATVPGQILQAILDVITATTITFSFKGPSSNGGRPIRAFQVQYKGEYQQWTEAKNKTWAYGSPYILEGLTPQTTYVFRFAAINDVGMSPWAAQQTVVMPKRSFPEEPKILHHTLGEDKSVVSPYHNKYELAWRIPADNGEPIDRYDIKYCAVQKVNNEFIEMEDEPCVTVEHRSLEVASYELQGLRSDTFYKVEIRAHNIIGFSVPGQLVIKTARGSDVPSKHTDSANLSSTTIISIVVAVLLIILVIVDVSCFFVNDTGLLHLMCGKSKKSKSEDDAKLGSLYSWRFPLPYCSNASASSSSASNSNSETEKLPLPPDVNFVFEGKELLNNGHRDLKVQIESAPMIDKKDTTVEFDLKKATSKTGFVGKDSAV